MFRRVATVIAWALVASIFAVPATASPGAVEPQPVETLVEQMLIASGLEGSELVTGQERVLAEVRSVAERLGQGAPSYRRANRLHDLLHRRYLRHYDPEADGVHEILEDGRYNCQAATFFMGLVARSIGIEAEILESPGHLKLRLNLPRRQIEVETTSVSGFDIAHRAWRRERNAREPERRLGAETSPAGPSGVEQEPYWRVSLEQAVGFAWLNSAWRTLEEGKPLLAVTYVVEADRYLPDLAERASGVRRLIARAFSLDYDAGRFDDAYGIALISLRLFPDSVYSHDRIVAVGLKLAERYASTDEPRRVDTMLDEIALLAPSVATNLERQTSPLLAAAAVRLQDWELAWSAARRFSRSEPDDREVTRLISWIEERSFEDPRAVEAIECAD
jgi:hypothetical protein